MNDFTLYCLGEGGKKGDWDFRPIKTGMRVTGPDGKVVGEFPHRHAQDRFTLPSFWRSIKNLGFTKDDGTTVWFAPDRKAVAAVRDYLDTALASQGKEAVRHFGRRGWLLILAGLGSFFIAIVLMLIGRALLGEKHRHAFYGAAALLLSGIGETAWGFSTLVRSARVKRRLRRSEG
jgi:hypothetical protein